MDNDKSTMLFFGLVYSMQMTAMQHLGKIKNPATDKVERSLPDAEAIIDMLEMLSTKTKGNLSEEESNLLAHILKDLHLNYVDEFSKEKIE
ncbi:MAG: DUF1844 domain-containing protein [Ignavibacteriales bacterium]|nr:DUF1844 domain-containing protein [Ignavibacteriales bacterium]